MNLIWSNKSNINQIEIVIRHSTRARGMHYDVMQPRMKCQNTKIGNLTGAWWQVSTISWRWERWCKVMTLKTAHTRDDMRYFTTVRWKRSCRTTLRLMTENSWNRECKQRREDNINLEHIELPAKLLDYFLRSNKSSIIINQHLARGKQISCWGKTQ